MKKTAVITDASSADFFFPLWRRYYGGLFGDTNLHVVTYAGMKPLFAAAGIGNVWEINAAYNDQLRAGVVADLITVLLHSYDAVLRCDVDEFIVADPARFNNLADFVEKNDHPYVTARGVNLIELGDDQPLDTNMQILGRQRRYGMRAAALNKTCLTTVPLRWAGGFHAANVFPIFSGLYNFHLKFADVKNRIAWHDLMMSGLTVGTSEHKYFAVGAEHLLSLQNHLARKPKNGAETEQEFDNRFLGSVTYNRVNHIYQGDFISQEFLHPVDQKFTDIF